MLFFLPAYTEIIQQNDTTLNRGLSHEDLVRGERLFHGLVYPELRNMKCSECHSTYTAAHYDTVNWNPDALEISLRYIEKSVNDLSRVLLNPAGQKMAEVHAGFKLTPEEVMLIKGFMDRFPEKGLIDKKPVITNLLLFIIASILFLAALTDFVFTKKLRKQWINLAILSVTGIYITWNLVVNAIAIGRSKGYSPDQPIKFSHAVHAGQNKTDCLYCHNYASYSKISGIPSGNVCMNCHLIVRNGKRSGTFEIARVVTAFENNKPIEWIQVHNLPDHVYYNHSQHVNAGGIQCQVCHGPVEQMDRIIQVRDLSMGWCVNCHRTRKVNFNENKFYSQYTMLSEKMRNSAIDSVTVDMQGGSECMRCHY
ncbi:MAG TPA: cytochrome c3 family protein [Bacteroidales bacterium]|nr:cytochrome c3 family protein [Bacteroidales bacterium]